MKYRLRYIPFEPIMAILISAILLNGDFKDFFIWSITLFVLGLFFLPLTNRFFGEFMDKGFIFTKIIALAICSYMVWLLSSIRLLRFSDSLQVLIATMIICILTFAIFKGHRSYISILKSPSSPSILRHIYIEEAIFILTFALWTFLRGIKPEIEGLEKFMDFGFLNSALLTDYMPPKDMWFAQSNINYYYFGQYVTAFITKITNVASPKAYNLMMALLFAFGFSLTYALSTNLLKLHGNVKKKYIYIGGLISAFLVTLGGNLHHVVYKILPEIGKNILKIATINTSYWFPDATRYIGYKPDTNDKTIHEFPLYSYIVSDLHAHVINTIFVITLLAILVSIVYRMQKLSPKSITQFDTKVDILKNFLKATFIPEFILVGVFIGIFQMSNFWDFPIYFVVSGALILYANLKRYLYRSLSILTTLISGVYIYLISALTALPFTLSFDQISTDIKIVTAQSPIQRLFVLWGYQLILFICFIFLFWFERNQPLKKKDIKVLNRIKRSALWEEKLKHAVLNLPPSDFIIILIALCGFGLILMPEIIYVKDIYEGDYKRANTMFKLTYQAFIMLGLCGGFIFARFFSYRSKFKPALFVLFKSIVFVFSILPLLYSLIAIPSWYGQNISLKSYKGIDGTAFIRENHSDDYEAINWLINNSEHQQPNILEADGKSYTYNGRISMATGFPTIQGWETHEWLWRNGYTPVKARQDEVSLVYQSDDIKASKDILAKYEIQYIIIGKAERDTFQNINENKLEAIGEIVFQNNTTKIIKLPSES